MPRPGPRPYECVRRSWHSDRHQPIRGSIIQQIFRVVHENHSPGTKKNREWQEKLPLVVLKSEEIMYSKANSEAEYLDPETLWDRVNDAINTIIRKDESMETDEFLPPCVEAALNLGCVPVRSSRSQRNSNTRSYLSPRTQDSGSAPPRTMDSALNAGNPNLLNVERSNVVNQRHSFSEINRDGRQNYKTISPGFSTYPLSLETFPKQIAPAESRASLGGTSSVYPLYYGLHFQPEVPKSRSHSNSQNSNAIIVGTPIFQAVCEPLPSSQKGFNESLFSFDRDSNSSKKTTRDESQPALLECDLSLRLGLVPSGGKVFCPDDDVAGPSDYQSTPPTKELSFFPLNSEGDDRDLVTDVRKRKAAFVNNNVVEGEKCFLHLEPSFDQINERMKRRGL